MMRRFSIQRSLLVAAWMLPVLISCVRGKSPSDSTAFESSTDYNRVEEAWVDTVLSKMTVEQMAGQTLMPAVYTTDNEYVRKQIYRYVDTYQVGGLVLLQGDTVSCGALAEYARIISPIPMFIAIDAEWGLGMRLEDAPVFPINAYIGENTSETALYDYGYEMARECRQLGINMLLGPVVDVVDNPMDRGVIGRRAFAGNAERVASLGLAYARGVEDGNVLSVAKHFPGHGAVVGDTHQGLQTTLKSRNELENGDLLPFRRYVENGLSGVMIGHLYASALDSIVRPATVSPAVLEGLLRSEMQFNGLIITDALNMGGAEGSSAADALMAGADIVLCPENTDEAYRGILKAVQNGTLPLDALKEKCRRILRYKYRLLLGEQESKGKIHEPLFTETTRTVASKLCVK